MTKRRSSASSPAARKRSQTHPDTEPTPPPSPELTSTQPTAQSRQSSSDLSSATLASTPSTAPLANPSLPSEDSMEKPGAELEKPDAAAHSYTDTTMIDLNAQESKQSAMVISHNSKDGDAESAQYTTSAQSLVPYNILDRFPLFCNGDVVITSKLDPQSTRTYQLHSPILARHSTFFANSFRETEIPHESWFYFTIEENEGNINIIRQNTTSAQRPRIHDTLQDGEVQIKKEDLGDAVQLPDPNIAVVSYYFQVFGAFYNIPPHISTVDIGSALIEAEGLVKVGKYLDCLPLIRPHINNAFGQYRKRLFLAIKSDPARWMQLAIGLEDTSIYTECLIHLVGAYPTIPWPIQSWRGIAKEIRDSIEKKSKALVQQCIETDRDLLMHTIGVGTGKSGKPVSDQNYSQRETWIVVQLFRDGFAGELRSLDAKDTGIKDRRSLERGTLYRRIHKGGETYMDYEATRARCLGIMGGGWKDLGDDLRMLKDVASNMVEDLATNELMIDPDANGIGYLTCYKVLDEDIPWKRVL